MNEQSAAGALDSAAVGAAGATDLRTDIRLLGRHLGDVLRKLEGSALFNAVEGIRQTATRFRRDGKREDASALDRLLERLSREDTISVVRAFSYFLHLANIAEDQHQVRLLRTARRRGEAPAGSLASTFALLSEHGVSAARVRTLLTGACLMPVLTAHPTEVRRKSILDTEREIARLLDARERAPATEDDVAAIDSRLLALIGTPWQTRMLRPQKLTVADEIANALSYWHSTFLPEIPKVYDALEQHYGGTPSSSLPSFLRLGCWIGGDRDGHPHVTASTMRAALRAQGETALAHYLAEVHALGAELSMSAALVSISEPMLRLAAAG